MELFTGLVIFALLATVITLGWGISQWPTAERTIRNTIPN